jgi:hypothetical protein
LKSYRGRCLPPWRNHCHSPSGFIGGSVRMSGCRYSSSSGMKPGDGFAWPSSSHSDVTVSLTWRVRACACVPCLRHAGACSRRGRRSWCLCQRSAGLSMPHAAACCGAWRWQTPTRRPTPHATPPALRPARDARPIPTSVPTCVQVTNVGSPQSGKQAQVRSGQQASQEPPVRAAGPQSRHPCLSRLRSSLSPLQHGGSEPLSTRTRLAARHPPVGGRRHPALLEGQHRHVLEPPSPPQPAPQGDAQAAGEGKPHGRGF